MSDRIIFALPALIFIAAMVHWGLTEIYIERKCKKEFGRIISKGELLSGEDSNYAYAEVEYWVNGVLIKSKSKIIVSAWLDNIGDYKLVRYKLKQPDHCLLYRAKARWLSTVIVYFGLAILILSNAPLSMLDSLTE